MTVVWSRRVSERGVSVVERFERGAAVLQLGAGVAARGRHVGVAEHVGDEREIAAVVADQPRGERVPRPCAVSSTPIATALIVQADRAAADHRVHRTGGGPVGQTSRR